MEEAEMEFNLLDEPWILVRTQEAEIKEVSLLDVFANAHMYAGLAGELPTQDVAVMRLLLAIMHAVFVTEDIEDKDDAIERWKEIWDNQKFPYEIIEEYLNEYRDRFWLFHPSKPFYQLANIRTAMDEFNGKKENKGTENEEKLKPVSRLIGELFQSDNKPRLCPGRIGKEQRSLAYGEAARWLLHLQGFDDNSAKKPTPKGEGYLGQLGMVLVQDASLFRTLMRNFVLVNQRDELFDDASCGAVAYWEKAVCEKVENLIVQPGAQKDLLTLQSRRILLRRKSGRVIGYLLTMGDYFDKKESWQNETMTEWRWHKEKNIFIPKPHKPEVKIWRELSSLLGIDADDNVFMPGVVYWQSVLREEGIISGVMNLRKIGASFEHKNSNCNIKDYVEDSLDISSDLMKEFSKPWLVETVLALKKVQKAVYALGDFADKLLAATGGDGKEHAGLKQHVREQCYHELDGAFRQWLLSIRVDEDEIAEKIAAWIEEAKTVIMEQADELFYKASEKNISIKLPRKPSEEEKNKPERGDIFIARNNFINAISRNL